MTEWDIFHTSQRVLARQTRRLTPRLKNKYIHYFRHLNESAIIKRKSQLRRIAADLVGGVEESDHGSESGEKHQPETNCHGLAEKFQVSLGGRVLKCTPNGFDIILGGHVLPNVLDVSPNGFDVSPNGFEFSLGGCAEGGQTSLNLRDVFDGFVRVKCGIHVFILRVLEK